VTKFITLLSRFTAIGVFALAPLPFGSVERPWIAIWLGLLAFSLATADYSYVRASQLWIMAAAVLVYGVFAAVALAQVRAFGDVGFADPMWETAGRLLGETLTPQIGVNRLPVTVTLAPATLFAAAFLRALTLGSEPGGAKLIARTIGWAALAYAVYGAVSLLLNPTMLLWREKEAYLANLTGTFINRNTAATYFGGATIIWLLAFIFEFRRRFARDASLQHTIWLLMRAPPGVLIVAAVGTLVCLCATAATGSRGGFLLTLVAGALACGFYLDVRVIARALGWRRLMFGLLGLILVMEIWGGAVASRLAQRGLADSGRADVYRASIEIINEHPVFGIGLGAFEAYFPSRRPASLGNAGIWDRAHSTPLEIAVEMGAPTAMLVILLFAWLLALLALASWRNRRRDTIIGLSVGMLGALHSCFDFSLQIPGYAVVYAALTGAGLARLRGRPRS